MNQMMSAIPKAVTVVAGIREINEDGMGGVPSSIVVIAPQMFVKMTFVS